MKFSYVALFVLLSWGGAAFAQNIVSVNRMLDESDFPDEVSRSLMGVENGEIVLFSSTPSETLTLDCELESGRLSYALYSESEYSLKQAYDFDSYAKCESFAELLRDSKSRLGSELVIKLELDEESQKIKSIHFSEVL